MVGCLQSADEGQKLTFCRLLLPPPPNLQLISPQTGTNMGAAVVQMATAPDCTINVKVPTGTSEHFQIPPHLTS